MQSNNHVADTKTFRNTNMMVATSLPSAGVLGLMSKTTQTQPQPRQPLKCPRCDSLNTKFCYYNNYSLSQPRHFCKACKRYWTRGGTLRNVPIGGGTCRKNKRIKRPTTTASSIVGSSSSSSIDGSSNSTTSSSTSIPHPQMNGYVNPLLYGLSDVSSGNTLPMITSRFGNSKGFESGFGFNGSLSDLGLGFPHIGDNMSNSMAATNKLLLPGLFGVMSSPSTPSMAALLASSSFHPQNLINGGDDHIPRTSDIPRENNLQTLASPQDLHVNIEGRLDHEISGYIGLSSDPSNYNTNAIGAWCDPNVAYSLSSLI